MRADKIKRNMMIHVDGLTLRVRDIGRDKRGKIRIITDAGTVRRWPIEHIATRAEITAGPVKTRPYARMPRTVRVSNGEWVGQRDGTTQERIISYSQGWDL